MAQSLKGSLMSPPRLSVQVALGQNPAPATLPLPRNSCRIGSALVITMVVVVGVVSIIAIAASRPHVIRVVSSLILERQRADYAAHTCATLVATKLKGLAFPSTNNLTVDLLFPTTNRMGIGQNPSDYWFGKVGMVYQDKPTSIIVNPTRGMYINGCLVRWFVEPITVHDNTNNGTDSTNVSMFAINMKADPSQTQPTPLANQITKDSGAMNFRIVTEAWALTPEAELYNQQHTQQLLPWNTLDSMVPGASKPTSNAHAQVQRIVKFTANNPFDSAIKYLGSNWDGSGDLKVSPTNHLVINGAVWSNGVIDFTPQSSGTVVIGDATNKTQVAGYSGVYRNHAAVTAQVDSTDSAVSINGLSFTSAKDADHSYTGCDENIVGGTNRPIKFDGSSFDNHKGKTLTLQDTTSDNNPILYYNNSGSAGFNTYTLDATDPITGVVNQYVLRDGAGVGGYLKSSLAPSALSSPIPKVLSGGAGLPLFSIGSFPQSTFFDQNGDSYTTKKYRSVTFFTPEQLLQFDSTASNDLTKSSQLTDYSNATGTPTLSWTADPLFTDNGFWQGVLDGDVTGARQNEAFRTVYLPKVFNGNSVNGNSLPNMQPSGTNSQPPNAALTWVSALRNGLLNGRFPDSSGDVTLTIRERGCQNSTWVTGSSPYVTWLNSHQSIQTWFDNQITAQGAAKNNDDKQGVFAPRPVSPTVLPDASMVDYINAYAAWMKSNYVVYYGNDGNDNQPRDITNSFFNYRATHESELRQLNAHEDDLVDRRQVNWLTTTCHLNLRTNLRNLLTLESDNIHNYLSSTLERNLLPLCYSQAATTAGASVTSEAPISVHFSGLIYVHRTPRYMRVSVNRYRDPLPPDPNHPPAATHPGIDLVYPHRDPLFSLPGLVTYYEYMYDPLIPQGVVDSLWKGAFPTLHKPCFPPSNWFIVPGGYGGGPNQLWPILQLGSMLPTQKAIRIRSSTSAETSKTTWKFTLWTPDPLYIQGDFNNYTPCQPCELGADNITVLSNDWNDAASVTAYTDHPSDAPPAVTSNVTIKATIITSKLPDDLSSEGVTQLFNYLEDWSSHDVTVYGSLNVLGFQATSRAPSQIDAYTLSRSPRTFTVTHDPQLKNQGTHPYPSERSADLGFLMSTVDDGSRN